MLVAAVQIDTDGRKYALMTLSSCANLMEPRLLCTITSVCMNVLQDDIYHHANVEMMYFIAHTVCACDKLNHSLLSLAVSVLMGN